MLALVDMLDTRWEANRPDIVKLEKASVDSLRSVVEAFVKNMASNAEPAVRAAAGVVLHHRAAADQLLRPLRLSRRCGAGDGVHPHD